MFKNTLYEKYGTELVKESDGKFVLRILGDSDQLELDLQKEEQRLENEPVKPSQIEELIPPLDLHFLKGAY